jgi:circadian clock protein KaiB
MTIVMTMEKNNEFKPKVDSNHDSRKLILFVVGNEPNSRLARQNMADLSNSVMESIEYTVVDVLEDFQTAVQYDILATPALVQIHPGPVVTILGNLNDKPRVLSALGLKEQQRERTKTEL